MTVDARRPLDVVERPGEWFLLDGNRNVLGAAIVAVLFALLWGLQAFGVFDTGGEVVPLLYLFGALIGGNFTLVTIVISINQLVLSRELRTPKELRSERDAARQYRDAVEEETDYPVVPEDPSDFLEVLIGDTRNGVDALGEALDGIGEEHVRTDVADLRERLREGLDIDIDTPAEAHDSVFPALSTVLDADFATWINHARWTRQTHAEELPDTVTESIESIEDRLEQLDVARQYFKTVYIQQELADLSKVVLYAGLVAVTVAVVFLVFVGDVRGVPAGARALLPAAVAVNLAPLVLLFAHVLRIATVARRTAAITPFISPN